MAVKELWVYLLAYNLIRLLMAQAALLADQIPRQLSFKHTVQIWLSWQQRASGGHDAAVCINTLLVLIAEPRSAYGRGESSRVPANADRNRFRCSPNPEQSCERTFGKTGTRRSSVEFLSAISAITL